jgi:hypothetical protein
LQEDDSVPRRRWRARTVRQALTPATRHYLETGEVPPKGHPERAQLTFFRHELDLEEVWRIHGAEITADWVRAHPDRKPWAWSEYGAPDA